MDKNLTVKQLKDIINILPVCINTTNDFLYGEVEVLDILKETISEGRNKND